jgi:hypothetical protein
MQKAVHLRVLAIIGAVLVAASVVWLAHDLMGVPPWILREDALFGAALIGVACAVGELRRK